jgi:hypothetical protein
MRSFTRLLMVALGEVLLCLAAGRFAAAADCNQNGVADATDIAQGTSEDCNRNAIPDECDLLPTFAFDAARTLDVPFGLIVTANLDADEVIDVAVARLSSNDVSVLRNNKDGTFTTVSTVVVGDPMSGLSAMAAGDLDGDGHVDLVVTSWDNASVSVLMNDGAGHLAVPVKFSAGSPLRPIVLADLDGDHDLDIVGVSITNYVVLKNDAGTFSPSGTLAGAGAPGGGMIAADLDGDGDVDLAVTEQPTTVTVFLNSGDATFVTKPPVFTGAGGNPNDIVAAHLDGDGRLDLVVSNEGRDDIAILGNQGNGVFMKTTAIPLPISYDPKCIVAADLDGDGRTDLATSCYNDIRIFLSDSGGTWSTRILDTGWCFSSLHPADLDGDGDTDFIYDKCNELGEGIVAALFNNPVPVSKDLNANGVPDECEPDCNRNSVPDDFDLSHGTSNDCNLNGIPDECDVTATMVFGSPATSATGTTPECVVAADLDGDGARDLAVANFGSASVTLFKNSGNGTFSLRTTLSAGSGATFVAIADLDGDGDQDLAVANQGGGAVSVMKNNGNWSFAPQVTYAVGSEPIHIKAADLDGDGDLDLAVANYKSASVSLLKNKGDGTFGSWQTLATAPGTYGPLSIAAIDLDGDGDIDLAVANDSAKNVSVFKNKGDGSFETRVNYPVGTGADPRGEPNSIVAADFNRDGHPDLATANWTSNTVSVLKNRGDGTFEGRVNYAVETDPTCIAAVDIDEDGDEDLVVSNYESDTLSILLNKGRADFMTVPTLPAGNAPYSMTSADLNGDGKSDLAVVNHVDNTVRVLSNQVVLAVSGDCNANGIPDECDIGGGASADTNANGIPDECDPDCNGNDIPDDLDITNGSSTDCNANDIPDECDIASHTSADCNANGIPDQCDITSGTSTDCNSNGVPDECDIASGASKDRNGDQIPDECQAPIFHRGDPNNNGDIDIADAVYLLSYLFADGAAPTCMESGDVNNSGDIDIADGISVLSFMFADGLPPADPGPTMSPCGSDPDEPGSPSDLGCETYDHCQ